MIFRSTKHPSSRKVAHNTNFGGYPVIQEFVRISIHNCRHISASRLKNRVPLYKRTDRLATVCPEWKGFERPSLRGRGLTLLNRDRSFSDYI
jgi:hypothetical protein